MTSHNHLHSTAGAHYSYKMLETQPATTLQLFGLDTLLCGLSVGHFFSI